MENASKALIIAGAILLAILIISLGIMIYNQASGVVNNNAMSEVDISTFNQKFTQYEGDNVRGAQVSSLLDQVRSNNITYQDDASRQVAVQSSLVGGAAGTNTMVNGTTNITKAGTGTTYKVQCFMDSNTGLVDYITITPNP